MTTSTRPPSPSSAEDRLRDAMQAYAAPIEPDPYAWTRIRGRIDEPAPKRSRTWTFASLGGLAALGALLVALLLPGSDSRTPAPPIGGGGPAGVVIVDDHGDLVVAPRGGEPSTMTRVGRAPSVLGPQLAVTPDARFAYVARRPRGAHAQCASQVVRVRLRDGATRVLAERAASPAISADGARLAYIELASPARGHIQCGATIVVRDLETGAERRWSDPLTIDVDPATGVGDSRFPNTLVWAPDGRSLAFVESFESENDVFVLDTTSPEGVLSATELRPITDPGPNRSWGLVGYLIDGSPLLRTHCYGTAEDCPGRTLVGVLDADGVVHETITLPNNAEQVTLDASGSWVLYVRFQNADSDTLEQLPLAEDARAEDLGQGVRFAAFLPSTQRDRR
jgi:hypothetical protein